MTSTNKAATLGHYVQAFFVDYMTAQRDLSPHTVLSYRDAMKLFLTFAARRAGKPVAELGFEHVAADAVLAFLEDLEKRRKNSVRTRNARLAALHSFFRYVATREPQVLEVCQRISAIPTKKAPVPSVIYLEHDEVVCVLGSIDRSTALGRRDHLLIHLLFETGVRASEIARLRTSALRLDRPYQLHVLAKGRKERICPLRAETAMLVRHHLREHGLTPEHDAPVFVGRCGESLTRYGVIRLVKRHVCHAAENLPPLAAKRVSPHTFRHAAAVHLLRAGNDLSTVRRWLGHVSIVTTDHYTEVDQETKRCALEASQPVPTPRGRPSWKRDGDLLSWLEAM
ncbi:MAG: site-specific integrase [Armatimonadetes bacterium]|nr:site-specific integrase [Armatimonadota bacterium]